jgi:hypothetical protein
MSAAGLQVERVWIKLKKNKKQKTTKTASLLLTDPLLVTDPVLSFDLAPLLWTTASLLFTTLCF